MRLSLQLYTLRDDLEADLEGTLQAVRDTGLKYVELAGDYGRSAQEWRDLLDGNGLKASGSHVGLEAFEKDADAAVADARLFGDPALIVPYISPSVIKDQLPRLKERIAAVTGRLKESGMMLLYHNHDHEMEIVNGRTILEDLLDGTDPEVFGLELDLAWVKIGGQDPVAYTRKLGPRVKLLHLKDYVEGEDGRKYVPGGAGIVPFDELLPLAEELGVAYGAIELDTSPDMPPIEAVRRSVEYFRGKGVV